MPPVAPTPKRGDRALKAALTAGRAVDLHGAADREISADLVKGLLTGPPLPNGVRISGATVSGFLDLADARGVGGSACNALILSDCAFVDDRDPDQPSLDARNSHLQRLSLTNCRLRGLDMSGAVILGDLQIDGLRGPTASAEEPSVCWIIGRGLRAEGAVRIGHTVLRLPWPSGDALTAPSPWPPITSHWPDVHRPAALDMRDARITGSLYLWPEFASGGGLNIAGAVIGGELWADGSDLAAPGIGLAPDVALFAQGVQVRGLVSLQRDGRADRPFRARGTLDLSLAQVGGTLALNGAQLSSAGPDQTTSLGLQSATVTGKLLLCAAAGEGPGASYPFTAAHDLDMTGASIAGEAVVQDGSHLAPENGGHRFPADLLAIQADFGSSLELDIAGRAILTEARVAASLLIDGRLVPNRDIQARGLRVGGDVTLVGDLEGTADLGAAVIEGSMFLGLDAEQPFAMRSTNRSTPNLKLIDARIAGDLGVRRVSTRIHTEIDWLQAPLRLRSAAPACYPGWLLVQAMFLPTPLPGSSPSLAVLSFLYRQRPTEESSLVGLLDGRSNIFHDINDLGDLRLETAEQAAHYLMLFSSHTWGDQGAFVIRPNTISRLRRDGSDWRATAEVEYAYALFEGGFRIGADGKVRMEEDRPLEWLVDTRQRLFASPLCWLALDTPADLESLEGRTLPAWPEETPLSQAPGLPRAASLAWSEVGLESPPEQAIWLALHEQQASLPPPAEITWPSHWNLPQIDLAGLRAGNLDDNDGQSWFDLDWVGDDDRRSARGWVGRPEDEEAFLALAEEGRPWTGVVRRRLGGRALPVPLRWLGERRRRWQPTVRLVLDGFEYAHIAATLATHKPGYTPPGLGSSSPSSRLARLGSAAWGLVAPVLVRPWVALARGAAHALRATPRVVLALTRRHERAVLLDRLWWREPAATAWPNRVEHRRRWLAAQYPDFEQPRPNSPERAIYSPQPYQHLAAVWRAEGLHSEADDISFEKNRLERIAFASSPITRVLRYWGFEFAFGYGLRWLRALRTFVLLWALGAVLLTAGTSADTSSVMKIDASNVGTVAAGSPGNPSTVVLLSAITTGALPEIPCGNHIDPALYALDVMVPLLDLRQEQRCLISAAPEDAIWRLFKVLYAVLGWVVVTGLVLTGSSVVQRQTSR